MTAASSLAVVGVDGPPLEGCDRVFHKSGLVECVRMDRYLHVHVVGHGQGGTNCGGGRPKVLMDLESGRTGLDLFYQGCMTSRVPFAEKPDVDRQPFDGPQHHVDVPGS